MTVADDPPRISGSERAGELLRRVTRRLDNLEQDAAGAHRAFSDRADAQSELLCGLGERMDSVEAVCIETRDGMRVNATAVQEIAALSAETLHAVLDARTASDHRHEQTRVEVHKLHDSVSNLEGRVQKLERLFPTRAWRWLLAAAITLLLLMVHERIEHVFRAAFDGVLPAAGAAELRRPATLDKLVDGDTAWFRVDGRRVKVRVPGIDAPESYNPGCPRERELGEAASREAARLLLSAERIELLSDPERLDRYGRLLAEVYIDGVPWSGLMLESGHALPWTGRRYDWCAGH